MYQVFFGDQLPQVAKGELDQLLLKKIDWLRDKWNPIVKKEMKVADAVVDRVLKEVCLIVMESELFVDNVDSDSASHR